MAAAIGTVLTIYLMESVLVLICVELLASRSHNLHDCVEILLVPFLRRNNAILQRRVFPGAEIDNRVCRYFLDGLTCVNFLFDLR